MMHRSVKESEAQISDSTDDQGESIRTDNMTTNTLQLMIAAATMPRGLDRIFSGTLSVSLLSYHQTINIKEEIYYFTKIIYDIL